MVAKLTDAQSQVFLEANLGVVATLRKDGSAQLTPVWLDADDGDVLFNTAEGRAKPRNLRRDPRVSVFVLDRADPYRWVAVSGRAALTGDGAVDHIDKLAAKYTGRESYGVAPGEQRLIVRVHADRIESRGVD
jgi:PPOX class probable F420-dependent enzyme